MGIGLGIGALVVALLSIFIPIYGGIFTVLSAALAAFSGRAGLGLGIGAIVVNIFNLWFMSPALHINGNFKFLAMFVLAQFVAAAFLFFVKQKSSSGSVEPLGINCEKCQAKSEPGDATCRYCSNPLKSLPAAITAEAVAATDLMPTTVSTSPLAEQIERLAALKKSGALSEQEYEKAKSKLLG
jgi:Short C-terminal domain